MSLTNKIIAAGLACGMAFTAINAASAATTTATAATSKTEGVIFRIENIKPIKNEEGLVSKCEFFVTVYNRTDRNIKEADLVLSWTDNVDGRYKVANGNLEVEKNDDKAKTVIKKVVSLKDITARQQKSFKDVVDTDKCFLLFDRVDYAVPTCIAEGDDIQIKNNKRMSNGSCTNAFDYVNSQNPEYYSEFKDIPESEMERMAEEQKLQDLKVIDDLFKQSQETIDTVAKKIGRIK